MATQSTLRLIDAVAEDTKQAGLAPRAGALGEQAAFIRALVDEVERHHPADHRVAALREQLGDELTRLAELIEGRPRAAAEREAQEASPLEVLVVDDEDAALTASVAVLRHLGYPCRTARNAEEALREFDREPAAIVLSDWSMPGMNGLELCTALKRREPRLYVILATAFHDNARLLDAVREGVDDFLHKPLDIEELEVRLLAATRLIRAMRTVTTLGERLRAAAARQEA